MNNAAMFGFRKVQKVDVKEEIDRILQMMTLDDYKSVPVTKKYISAADYQAIWFRVGDIIVKNVSQVCEELGLSNSDFAYSQMKKMQDKAARIVDVLYDIKW